MRRIDPSWLLAGLRFIRIPAILVALYLVLYPVMAALSARHGFGSPDGLGPGYLVVTVVFVALRVLLVAIVPAVLAYRVVAFAVTRLFTRRVSRSPHRSC